MAAWPAMTLPTLGALVQTEANRTAAGDAGAVEAVVAVVTARVKVADVVQGACAVLCQLTQDHAANQERAGQAGALAALVAAIAEHNQDKGVVLGIGKALECLVRGHSANQQRADTADVQKAFLWVRAASDA